VDGRELFTGSYNLSDNAEHETFENMVWIGGAGNAETVQAYEKNFARIWETGRDGGKLEALRRTIEQAPVVPIVFEPMALDGSEVTALKQTIRASCPAVDSVEYRKNAASKLTCRK
jgi:phosphatidylserine/phosphatidylglycerophosphate/cardiolipin synthase-like enzyme